MGLSTQPCGVPVFQMMLADVLFPILTYWGLPIRKFWSQSQMVGCRPSVDSLSTWLGKLLDLYGGHDVVNTSANIPIHILSIVLYADRRVWLQCGCSFKHIPVCLSKTVSRVWLNKSQGLSVSAFVCMLDSGTTRCGLSARRGGGVWPCRQHVTPFASDY